SPEIFTDTPERAVLRLSNCTNIGLCCIGADLLHSFVRCTIVLCLLRTGGNLIAHRSFVALVILIVSVLVVSGSTQQFDPKLFQEMRWRSIGPFRGGRTVAISGIPSQPKVFFMAPNNGGVWKSTDYGQTW